MDIAATSPEEWKSPLRIYLAWRPGGAGEPRCAALADELCRELCRDPQRPLSRGLGIPVFFRSTPAQGSSLPLPVDLDSAKRVCVIALLDFDSVFDEEWVEYLTDIRRRMDVSDASHLFLPVAVDREALGSGAVGDLNAIRHYDSADTGTIRTRSQILHELCRQMADDTRPHHEPAPVRLFLSHAKLDGDQDAQTLKRRIEEVTSAKPFFDSVDIAPGYKFAREIEETLKKSVFIGIVTDAYSSRPWCRQEVLMAKKHERPMVLVNALQREDQRLFPYLGNVPVVGRPDQVDAIIHAALLEALRFTHARQRLEGLREAGRFPRETRIMARPPELIDLQLFLSPEKGDVVHRVVYPDPPLGQEELEALGGFCGTTQFLTAVMPLDTHALQGRRIGLSFADGGGLAAAGLSSGHLSDAMVEIARHLLARGATLVYGGDLRMNGFTWNLFDLAFTYVGGADKDRIHNYQAWISHRTEAPDARRRLAGWLDRATFHRLPAPDGVAPQAELPEESTLAFRYLRGRSYSDLRRVLQHGTDARIALGGKTSGYLGAVPGLLEEVELAMRAETPVYLIGGFGGCARAIAEAIEGGSPASLTFDEQCRIDAGYADFVAYHRSQPESVPIDYESSTRFLREKGFEGLNNGLSKKENRRLFESIDLDEIDHLVLKGLERALGRP